MKVGTLQTRSPEPARIIFEDPRLETDPTNNPAVGEIPVFISQELLTETLGTENAGGLLLGRHGISNGVEFLEIQAVSAAAEPGSTGLPFAEEQWGKILRQGYAGHPDLLGLGWWVARNGAPTLDLGEKAFHQALFPLSWQIALLADPGSQTARSYHWKQGRLEECGFFIVHPRRN
ncbi:MAG: hypothetical protein O7H41_07110 [Planctomycetota bacterium]|nr:hypothetical protein [Planctomycetota bacterium]